MLETPTDYKIKSYSETPLEDFLDAISQNREAFEQPEIPTVKPEPVVEPLPEVIKQTAAEIKSRRENTAKWLGKNTDRAFAFLADLITNTDDIDDWKASPEDLKDIIDCYFEMCEGYGWTGLPPWINLVLCLGFTYAPTMREAVRTRGINKHLAAVALQAKADLIIAQQQKEVPAAPAPTPAETKLNPET